MAFTYAYLDLQFGAAGRAPGFPPVDAGQMLDEWRRLWVHAEDDVQTTLTKRDVLERRVLLEDIWVFYSKCLYFWRAAGLKRFAERQASVGDGGGESERRRRCLADFGEISRADVSSHHLTVTPSK